MQTAFNILTKFFSQEEYGSIDPDTVTRDTELKSIGIDSLDMSCLLCDLEEHYKIVIKDSDYMQKKLVTVGDVSDLVDECSKR